MARDLPPLRVFISYSWLDKALARRIARRLAQCGADVFLDEDRQTDLAAGDSISATLESEIAQTGVFVVVWTPAAAASAASGGWVAHEIAYAAGSVRLLPLLFWSPKDHPVINDALGIEFDVPHRFEDSFANVVARLFDGLWCEPDASVLARDLTATLAETPSIAGLLGSFTGPGAGRSTVVSPAAVTTLGLPVLGSPDYHALDFALWCVAKLVVSENASARSLAEIEAWRHVFARVLASTGAGFDALLVLVVARPENAMLAMQQVIGPARLIDAALPAAVELHDVVTRTLARSSGGEPPVSTDALWRFFAANRSRLSDEQRLTIARLVDVVGAKGPYNGGPLDLMGELVVEPEFRDAVIQRVRHWVEAGQFDATSQARASLHPRYFYGFVAGMFKSALPVEAGALLDAAAYPRIRSLFRSGDSSRIVLALQWIVDANRLPLHARWVIERAFQDGVYSVEFEAWPHAADISPAGAEVVRALTSLESPDGGPLSSLNRALRQVGLDPIA
jgi:hypothetical protein